MPGYPMGLSAYRAAAATYESRRPAGEDEERGRGRCPQAGVPPGAAGGSGAGRGPRGRLRAAVRPALAGVAAAVPVGGAMLPA